MFAGKKSAQIREILISESAWEEMTCLFAPSLVFSEKKYYTKYVYNNFTIEGKPQLQGIVKINIRGGVVASAGQYFEKQYEINIQK